MCDQRLIDLFDQVGEDMKMVASYKEELRLQGYKAKKLPYISHEPDHQAEAYAKPEAGPTPHKWQVSAWRNRCPSGWFTEQELERCLDGKDSIFRVIYYLKRSGAIRFSPQANAYRKAFLV